MQKTKICHKNSVFAQYFEGPLAAVTASWVLGTKIFGSL